MTCKNLTALSAAGQLAASYTAACLASPGIAPTGTPDAISVWLLHCSKTIWQ